MASNLQQAVVKIADPNTDICLHSNSFDKSINYCAFDSKKVYESNACFGGLI